jgi:ribose transport system permease protein
MNHPAQLDAGSAAGLQPLREKPQGGPGKPGGTRLTSMREMGLLVIILVLCIGMMLRLALLPDLG